MSAYSQMVISAAKALCKINSDACNVNNDDNWKVFGSDFLIDAEAALFACGAPDLLEALEEITADYSDRFDLDSPSTNPGIKTSIARASAAISKAKGQ